MAGLLVAVWAVELARDFFAVSYVGTELNVDLSLDGRIVAAAIVLATITGVVIGVLPALQSTRPDLTPELKEESRGVTGTRTRVREALIVLQVAVSVVLLVCSALLVRSFVQLREGPGFDPSRIVMMRLRPSLVDYDPARARVFQREVIRRLEAMPGVVAASPAGIPPLPGWREPSRPVHRAGDPTDAEHALPIATMHVGPRYFETLGADVENGREFDVRDGANAAPVIVVNQTLARQLWPGGGAIGNTLTISGRSHEVVGVVRDLQFVSAQQQAEPIVYLNYWQQDSTRAPARDAHVHVRVSGDAAVLLEQIRQEIRIKAAATPFRQQLRIAPRIASATTASHRS